MEQIHVIVPAFNEGRHIEHVVTSIPAYVERIWVIDDGSQDDTWARLLGLQADQPRLRLLRHPHQMGVGAALRTGYHAAFGLGADVVAVLAGDGQMDPQDLAAVLAPILAGNADYVKGNRLVHQQVRQTMPLSRWLGNQTLSRLTRLATGLHIDDSQCGYTALSRAGATRLPLAQLWPSYGYPNDLLGWAAIRGLRVAEAPVRPIYGSEISGVRLHHALLVVPGLLLRAAWRRTQP